MKYYDIGFLWNIMPHGCSDMNQSLQNSQTLGQFFEPLYVGGCGLLWGANAPWHQRVSCRCQLTLPPTLLSLRAIAFAGPQPLMDPSMGPRWREMAMRGGRTSGGQAGIVTWLHAAQEMGESVLAVHPPRPLTTTDIALHPTSHL